MDIGAGVARGEPVAEREADLADLFDRHYDALRRLAYVLLRDVATAEEVAMEAFARVLTVWGRVRQMDAPELYLRKIVVNLCRSRWRRLQMEWKANRVAPEARAWVPPVDADHLDLWDAVDRLPLRQKQCVVLRYLDDLSEPGIAEVLQIPLGTVKTNLHRARLKLAAELGEP